jgi:Flp pilus assembly protein TadD
MSLFHEGRLRDAVEQFGKATEHPATQARAFSLAGEGFYKLGQPDNARRALLEAVRHDPNDPASRRWLAAACYDQGLMSDALPHLRKIEELVPEDPRPHRLEGLILKDFELYSEAIEPYRETLRLAPQQPQATAVRTELAECLIKALQPKEALTVLEPAPDVADVLALRAEALRALGNAEEARKLVEAAVQESPDHSKALTLLGTMELEAAQPGKAIAALEKAARAEPGDVAVQHQLAQAYRLAGRNGDAERQTQRLVEVQNLRSRFTELHEQAMASPGDAGVRYELGTIATKLGWPDLAIMWYRTSLAIDPNHSGARERLSELAAQSQMEPRSGR